MQMCVGALHGSPTVQPPRAMMFMVGAGSRCRVPHGSRGGSRRRAAAPPSSAARGPMWKPDQVEALGGRQRAHRQPAARWSHRVGATPGADDPPLRRLQRPSGGAEPGAADDGEPRHRFHAPAAIFSTIIDDALAARPWLFDPPVADPGTRRWQARYPVRWPWNQIRFRRHGDRTLLRRPNRG